MDIKMKKSTIPSIIISIILFVIGLLLLLKSDTVIKTVSIALGILIIIAGIVMLIKYFKSEVKTISSSFNFGYGVISIIAGAVLILNPTVVASLLPFVIGIFVVTSSIMRLQNAIELKATGTDKWVTPMILAIINLMCGILCIFGPFIVANIIIKFIGVILMVYALIDIIDAIAIGQATTSVTTITIKPDKENDDIPDAEVEDVKPSKKKTKKSKKES